MGALQAALVREAYVNQNDGVWVESGTKPSSFPGVIFAQDWVRAAARVGPCFREHSLVGAPAYLFHTAATTCPCVTPTQYSILADD